MNFIEFCINNGYRPYRKNFNVGKRQWEYEACNDNDYFSSSAPSYVDIRLLKDGKKEIVYGIPGCFGSQNGLEKKTHFPTLIYPNPFGGIADVDRAFKELTFEAILSEIEKM